MEIYEKIRNLRDDADKSQEQVAKYLGITRPQYSLYETGKREFKLEHIRKLCLYYNISADAILNLPEGMPYSHSKTKRGEKKHDRA